MYRAQFLLGLFLYVALVHSWEVAVSYANKIIFFDANGTRLYTLNLSFENHNITALTYDEVHNMLLYIDKQNENNDTICGYDISSIESKCFIKRNGGNIRAIAFDPATELLFFSDTTSRSIRWISLKPGYKNKNYGYHLITMTQGIPTDMAIDSCAGFLYWMKTNITTNTSIIERAKFDGTEREFIMKNDLLIINETLTIEPSSLTIDLQTQKLYWIQPGNTSVNRLWSSELDGTNRTVLNVLRVYYYRKYTVPNPPSSVLTVSNKVLLYTNMRYDLNITVWKLGKLEFPGNVRPFEVNANHIYVGVAVNYKVKDRIRGIENCKPLSSLSLNCEKPFCVHGEKVIGKPHCKCKPGYIGDRCDVTVCKNYCIFGNCTSDDKGVPKCSCNAGYYGKRCNIKKCNNYCLNEGVCSLNKNNEPVCKCKGHYTGDRCEIWGCYHYCVNGKCDLNKKQLPECSCNNGYNGKRCDTKKCSNFCFNNGVCSLDKNNNPVCKCKDIFVGNRCELINCMNYCIQGTCTFSDAMPYCRCKPGFSGKRCDKAAPFI